MKLLHVIPSIGSARVVVPNMPPYLVERGLEVHIVTTDNRRERLSQQVN
jgi:hypothetical protein